MTDYLVPGILILSCAMALRKKENAYDLMITGASDGMKLMVRILPVLIVLMTSIAMLRSSGAA